MRAGYRIRLRLRSVFRRGRVERELAHEYRFHLDQLVEEEMAAGVAPDEARRSAIRKMGDLSRFQEESRDMRRVNYIDDVLRDARYAARNLRRSPGFTALAVLIMASGIGANTAVFSVVNAVILRPLPYRNPDRIVALQESLRTGEGPTALSRQVSILNFQDWHNQSSAFEAMAYYTGRESAVMPGATAEYAQVTSVSPEFFRVFGLEPAAGRFFSAEETRPGSSGAVIISDSYWRSRFGGDPGVLGKTIRVSTPRTIVGILPPGFRFPQETDLWIPAEVAPQPRTANNFLAIARIKPGVSAAQAQSEMSTIARRLEQQYPESNKGRTVRVVRLRDDLVGEIRLTLYLLLGAVGVVLLIACTNTATLLLGKATARTREVAVRAALGASRPRIVRQLVTESLALALLAGAAGLLLAYAGSKALVALAPSDLPRLAETGIDARVLAFTLGITMITSLLFGLAPALYASKLDVSDALKQGAARVVSGAAMSRMRGILVVCEITLAVVLLCGAGLLIKSFVALHNVALGYRPENVLVMRATMPGPWDAALPRARRFFKDVLRQGSALPGVLAAGATMSPPGSVDATGVYFADRLPPQREWIHAPGVVLSIVAPGTFAALGIPLKSGRDFNDGDNEDRPRVAVVNEALARNAFPNQNPLGRTVYCPFDSLDGMTIIGVAGDVRQRGPEKEPMAECYLPYGQHAFNGMTLSIVARTSGDPRALAETLRRVAHQESPDVPMKFTTMETLFSENIAAPRFRTLLLTIFAGLAVSLAMAGVYGVMAYAIGQRSGEIGLRMALGASSGSVLRLVLGQGLGLAALGLVLGLAAAVTVSRLLKSMLFRVETYDPAVYLGVAALLGLVALAACYVPARRASRIDPLTALREE